MSMRPGQTSMHLPHPQQAGIPKLSTKKSNFFVNLKRNLCALSFKGFAPPATLA